MGFYRLTAADIPLDLNGHRDITLWFTRFSHCFHLLPSSITEMEVIAKPYESISHYAAAVKFFNKKEVANERPVDR